MGKETFETMNKAIEAADLAAHKANRAAVKDLESIDCSRCGGKGYDYFLGGSNAPGQCFKCGGAGTVMIGKNAKLRVERAKAIELERVKAVYRAVTDALEELKASPEPGFAYRQEVKELSRKAEAYANRINEAS